MNAVLGLVTVVLTAAVQLVSVTIDVVTEPNRVVIDGSYVYRAQPDSVRFVLAKFRGQSVRITRGDWRLRERDGLSELVLPGSGPPFDVQYTIEGPVARIPLFVPDTPTESGGKPIAIRVRGVGDFPFEMSFRDSERVAASCWRNSTTSQVQFGCRNGVLFRPTAWLTGQ